MRDAQGNLTPKYKFGDKVYILATVVRIDDYGANKNYYRVLMDNGDRGMDMVHEDMMEPRK